jgi:hypothetical protein
VLTNVPEPRLFYDDILRLFERKQNLERNLEISKDIIIVVQDFTPLQQEEWPIIKLAIILGGSMAVLGIFCSLLWQYRKTIWKLIREDGKSI